MGYTESKIFNCCRTKKNHFKEGKALDTISKLRIIKTSIDNIDFLGRCAQLKSLELIEMSKLENLDILGTLINLIHLRIEANKTRDFSFIANLVNLQTCYLSSKNAEMEFDDFKKFNDIHKIVVEGNNNTKRMDKLLQEFYFK